MEQSTFISAFCLFIFIGMCQSHLCLISPIQRHGVTTADLNNKASNACFIIDRPCGKTKQKMPSVALRVGKNFTVIFQKNLDHFLSSSPGYFSVSLLLGDKGVPKLLATIADSTTPSLYIYALNFKVPSDLYINPTQEAVLQVQYVTKNPKAPAVFYQCADVILT